MDPTVDEIKRQEEEIFNCLQAQSASVQDDASLLLAPSPLLARLKALQQLRVSDDSPFSSRQDLELSKSDNIECNERADKLRRETEDIKRQLELVRGQLGDLGEQRRKLEMPSEGEHKVSAPRDQRQRLRPLTGKTDCPNCSCDRRLSVCDKCLDLAPKAIRPLAASSCAASSDARATTNKADDLHSNETGDHVLSGMRSRNVDDERPIRPAPMYRQQQQQQQQRDQGDDNLGQSREVHIDRSLVPGRIYSIGRSLNDKRSKLAQAIEDLQSMMEKVKQRSERLDQERRLAQLYKQQWRYGPQLGGRLAARRGDALQANYSSRLDPELARDTNSLMGFQNVEPTLRLRQYTPTSISSVAHRQHQARPMPKPRFSKMRAQTLASQAKIVAKRAVTSRTSMNHSRSRSLDSLGNADRSKDCQPKDTRQARATAQVARNLLETSSTVVYPPRDSNFRATRSASDNNLSARSSPDAIAEELEADIKETEEPGNEQQTTEAKSSSASKTARDEQQSASETPDGLTQERVQRMTWIPVFGETEIKTVTNKTPRRKTQVLRTGAPYNIHQQHRHSDPKQSTPRLPQASILRTSANNPWGQTAPINQVRTAAATATNKDRVLVEAQKKLQFASDLLDKEQADSRSKNQITVVRSLPASPVRRASSSDRSATPVRATRTNQASGRPMTRFRSVQEINRQSRRPSDKNQDQTQLRAGSEREAAKSLLSNATQEISRLEQMISQQQRVLAQLAAANINNQDPAPACMCPCCRPNTNRTAAKTVAGRPQQCNSSLIHSLRDKLQKTKARLARTLEEERARHQRLEQKVSLSLHKQTDLEQENELLKRSLSKCIDTCLRDITNTFESLNDSLVSSVDKAPARQQRQVSTMPPPPPTPDTDTNSNESPAPASPMENTITLSTTNDNSSETTSCSGGALANAAQLISNNKHLRRMKSHIEFVERQRRGIFEELSNEKQRSQKLELELRRSKEELEQLNEAKSRLESRLSATCPASEPQIQPEPSTSHKQQKQTFTDGGSLSNDEQQETRDNTLLDKSVVSWPSVDDEQSQNSSTYNSIDLYRQYIKSMSPDLDALRSERQMILSEFDNIKKVLLEMNN